MDKRACRLSGIVAAAGIGLALSTGVAAADPSSTETSGPEATASADHKPDKQTEKSRSGLQPTGGKFGGSRNNAGPVDTDDTDDTADTADTDGDEPDTDEAGSDDTDSPDDRDDRDGTDAEAPEEPQEAKSPAVEDVPTTVTPATDDPAAEPEETAPAAEAETAEAPTIESTPLAEPAPPAEVTTEPTRVASELLSTSGVSSTPTAPVENPVLAFVLAWVRRQFVQPPSAGTGAPTPPASSTSTPSTTINVKDYGAIGDGIADDSAAIKAAEAALTSGGRLYFPDGDYRFAQQNPAGNAAIVLKGLSNVTVEFEPGARLLMDNLAPNGHGTGHGIRVEGAASHVTLLNPTIEWVTRPAARSFGDGISVLGWPSDTAPPAGWTGSTGMVEFVSIVNGRVVNAPQAGAVIMGASDVTVTNFTAIGTLADGLHFNANRRVTVNGLVATDNGDDGLAFVTYYHPTQPWTYGPTDGPFNQTGVGEWNNGGSTATNITVSGGRANGFRVQGGYDITISDVTVTDKEFGFHVNSAIATGPGDWTSLASRNISISDVTITGAQTGIVLATNNIDGTEDPMWWDFSGVEISDVVIRGSKNWSLAVETPATTTSRLAGVTLRNIYAESMTADGPTVGGNGGLLLASLRDSVIDNVRLVSDHPSDINLLGAGQVRNGVSVADLPSSNLTVNNLTLEGPGRILIQDIAGVQFGNVSSYGAQGSAVVLYRVKDASFGTITAYLPARGSGGGVGVQILQVHDLDIDNIVVTTDDHVGSYFWAVELGGGNPDGDIAGDGVRIDNVTYVSGRDATDSHIVWQGGPYAPVNWYINATWLHQGESVPQWRSALYGDISPL